MNPKLSIAIPCYEMQGQGVKFLRRSLRILDEQSVDDQNLVEIVISDHSLNDDIEQLCLEFPNLNIRYFKNETNRGSMSGNMNYCISKCRGKYIKPLFQDDCLYNSTSLESILDGLVGTWMAYEYIHLDGDSLEFYNHRVPFYNSDMVNGTNTIGPPSTIVFLNDDNYFDENLLWFMDTEFYHRLNLKYGGGADILNSKSPLIVVTTWSGQTTETSITQDLIDKERSYIKHKHVTS